MTVQIDKKPWVPADKFDVQNLLRKYKLWHKFKNHELRCDICSNEVTLDNLGSIFEDEINTKIKLICDNPRCIRLYLKNRVDKVYI